MSGWDVLAGRASVPAGMLAELASLRAALPAYDVIVTRHRAGCRFKAIRRHGDGPGPWCVISTDPADLWRELAGRAPPAADGDRADRALGSARAAIGCHPADRIPRLDDAAARPTAR